MSTYPEKYSYETVLLHRSTAFCCYCTSTFITAHPSKAYDTKIAGFVVLDMSAKL